MIWFWLGQFCRYWEQQCRFLNQIHEADPSGRQARRAGSSPGYMRLVIDNRGN